LNDVVAIKNGGRSNYLERIFTEQHTASSILCKSISPLSTILDKTMKRMRYKAKVSNNLADTDTIPTHVVKLNHFLFLKLSLYWRLHTSVCTSYLAKPKFFSFYSDSLG